MKNQTQHPALTASSQNLRDSQEATIRQQCEMLFVTLRNDLVGGLSAAAIEACVMIYLGIGTFNVYFRNYPLQGGDIALFLRYILPQIKAQGRFEPNQLPKIAEKALEWALAVRHLEERALEWLQARDEANAELFENTLRRAELEVEATKTALRDSRNDKEERAYKLALASARKKLSPLEKHGPAALTHVPAPLQAELNEIVSQIPAGAAVHPLSYLAQCVSLATVHPIQDAPAEAAAAIATIEGLGGSPSTLTTPAAVA